MVQVSLGSLTPRPQNQWLPLAVLRSSPPSERKPRASEPGSPQPARARPHRWRSPGGGPRPASSAAARRGPRLSDPGLGDPGRAPAPPPAARRGPQPSESRAANTHCPWRRLGRPGGARRPRRCLRSGPAARVSPPAPDALLAGPAQAPPRAT